MILLTVNSNEQDLKKTDSRNPSGHNETGFYCTMVTKTELNSFQVILHAHTKKRAKFPSVWGACFSGPQDISIHNAAILPLHQVLRKTFSQDKSQHRGPLSQRKGRLQNDVAGTVGMKLV